MPREGIDYPGWFNRAACSIRCELSKLWSAVGTKLSKINTVEPDGDGKVKILSDSATLTVTDDPSNNAVRLELDAGLSSPPVQSVNGATGAVVLGGSDISSPTTRTYNGTTLSYINASVRTLLILAAEGAKNGDDALRTRMTAAESAISTETSARQSADNALAAQIATKAGVNDTIVKNPVAAQSIAGYDLEIQEDLDVDGDLTVGGTSDISVATGTTGTYNTKAANSQRIKNELDAYSPMVRTTGNQTIAGDKTFDNIVYGTAVGRRVRGSYNEDKWYDIWTFSKTGRRLREIKITMVAGSFNDWLYVDIHAGPGNIAVIRTGNISTSNFPNNSFAIGRGTDNKYHFLMKGYDNRWDTEIHFIEEYRDGTPMDGNATSSPAPMNDLSAYSEIIYGS